ncbi:phenoloxidase 1-like [Lycorma delicatula]|uniref:phenoloxidase 1-like n=1 Tax=Lycorma delicatula TaxID=130591 RepID=UPI003F50D8EA
MSTEAEDIKYLLDLLDRPNEPIFLPKGDDGVIFGVPEDYLEDRFKGSELTNRFSSSTSQQVALKKLPSLPDLDLPLNLPKRDLFSLFIPLHRRMAARLVEVFMGMRNIKDFLTVASFCRENMNPQLFNYALSVAIIHRPDTQNVEVPPLSDFFPDKFIDGSLLPRAREEAEFVSRGLETTPLEIPLDYTGTDLEPEHRVAYFREDLGINLHHWHWRLVYPHSGPINVINKDRRGELFYYMHEQFLARYNAERLCNRLERTKRFSEWREPIPEGYFPKLDRLSASRTWAARAPNTVLKDINRPAEQLVFDIQDLERWRNRLYEAVHTGRVIDNDGQVVQLNDTEGIDILGNLVEASDLSRNPRLYGDIHNLGHVAIALSHDPDHRHLEAFSVMGDSAVAMRDPMFYRWHAFIDDIFQDHKNTLSPYTAAQLDFSGVRVSQIQLTSPGLAENTLGTYWQKNDVNLVRGLDFTPRSNVFARFTHLQHVPFEYKITVNNSGQARQGTVRIFIAPEIDERGQPFLYDDQRKLMIELDKFTVNLQPNQNTITRSSIESTVTIPFERTFRDLNSVPSSQSGIAEFNYCGCGWPQHLLIPKGSPEGFRAVLFVMITNFQDDRVQDQGTVDAQSLKGISFCGIKDSRYPDRKAMGYPFDRVPRAGADTLQEFLTPNMSTQRVTIRFYDVTAPPGNVFIPGKGIQSSQGQQGSS